MSARSLDEHHHSQSQISTMLNPGLHGQENSRSINFSSPISAKQKCSAPKEAVFPSVFSELFENNSRKPFFISSEKLAALKFTGLLQNE